jgi:hypothetical protein
MVEQWWNRTMAFRFYDDPPSPWYDMYVNSSMPYWDRNSWIATVFVLMHQQSPADESTNWWLMVDSFVPELPTFLPHFWDPKMRKDLLGWSTVNTWIDNDLANWTTQYDMVASAWPSFKKEITLAKFLAMRGHMRTAATIDRGSSNVSWIPLMHMMRRSSMVAPNVNIRWDWAKETIRFRANRTVLKNEELFTDSWDSWDLTKIEYLLRFGAVRPDARDAATLPNIGFPFQITKGDTNTILNLIRWIQWQTNKDEFWAQWDAFDACDRRRWDIPLAVSSLGADPDDVLKATMLLQSERDTLEWCRDFLGKLTFGW